VKRAMVKKGAPNPVDKPSTEYRRLPGGEIDAEQDDALDMPCASAGCQQAYNGL
jgi:hypothetical protein